VSHDLLPAYALDAVDATERVDVERHLDGCGECAAELTSFREALGAFALSEIADATPPPALRAAVLTAIETTPQRAGVIRTPLRRRVRLVSMLAGVVVLALLGLFAVQQMRQPGGGGEDPRIAAVLAAPDARLVRADAKGGGEVSAVISERLSQTVVTLRGLPSGDKGHAYQLWIIRSDSRPDPAGVLDPGVGDGVRLVDGIADSIVLGVTQEPAGGSATPTLPMIAALPLD